MLCLYSTLNTPGKGGSGKFFASLPGGRSGVPSGLGYLAEMGAENRKNPPGPGEPRPPAPIVEDTDVHYGPATRPQGWLPFSIRVRRKYRWWPGPERYGALIDRLLLVTLLAPGVVWGGLSFGWVPALFVVAELVVVGEIVYRVATGTMLGE